MAKVRYMDEVRLLGIVRRNRPALMMSTALQATAMLVLALPADAQPAPNARPTGGTVVAGAAAISQTSGNTRVDQSTQRAAVNWKSFDIGSQQSVTFRQPTTSSVTLNRVTGPDPSHIAGRIDANGQIVLVNQSGVTFYKGAQVNANGLMVSAADISNKNFMAGVMKFDQPASPNARIENQGSITIRDAGLAALVAPHVANSGVINARLGHVVLAGAKTATLDLYGDGLLSLDVSNQVTQTPVDKNGNAATALVTNTGVIVADGGTVQLTARAADGIVQNLVQASGTIQAATVGDRTGTVALNGVGGSIVVEGQLSAPGYAPGTKGGAIEVATSGNVVVASTAKIDASGKAGGGLVAIGTTLNRAKGGPAVTPKVTATNVTVQKGATITANATAKGEGGRVTLLSTDTTHMNGTISARGGTQGGNGGFVEVSGKNLGMTGSVDVSAPYGAPGTLLLDPDFLTITADPGSLDDAFSGSVLFGLDVGGTDTLSSRVLNAFTGNVVLQASQDLTVASSFSLTSGRLLQTLTLQAGGTLTVNAGVSVTASGDVILATGGAGPAAPPGLASPLISVLGSVMSTGGSASLLSGVGGTIMIGANGSVNAALVNLNSGSGGIALTGGAAVGGVGGVGAVVDITSAGPVSQSSTSTIVASTLTSSGGVIGDVSLTGTGNAINLLRDFTVTGGDLILVNSTDLTLAGTLKADDLFFEVNKAGGTLTFGIPAPIDVPAAVVGALVLVTGGDPAVLTATGENGRISLVADNYVVTDVISESGLPNSITTTAGTVELAPFSPINTSLLGSTGLVVGPTLLSIIQTGGGTLAVGGFTNVPAGATAPAASASSVTIDGATDLTAIASTLRLDSTGPITQPGGSLTGTNLAGTGGAWTLNDTGNSIAALGDITATSFALTDSRDLAVNGTLAVVANATIVDAGTLTIPGLVSAGTVSLTAGTISETGVLIAGTLTGNAVDAANLAGNNQIATIGNFSAGSFTLNNSTDLLIGGTLNAADIAVRAPANQISLGDRASIVTSGSIRPPGPIQTTLEPVNGAPGALFQSAGFTQIGSSTVVGQGGGPATLQIAVTGNMQFDPQHSLQAPGTWLILNLTNGTAVGEVFVNALDVSYATPGGTNLRGAIQGINDGTAATLASIQPAIDVNYLFNGCVIGATVCQPPSPPPPIPPPVPPVLGLPDSTLTSALGGLYHPFLPGAPPDVIGLQRLVLVALPMLPGSRPQLTDPDVVPPNISYLDY